jgi:uncharacterized protein YkwD
MKFNIKFKIITVILLVLVLLSGCQKVGTVESNNEKPSISNSKNDDYEVLIVDTSPLPSNIEVDNETNNKVDIVSKYSESNIDLNDKKINKIKEEDQIQTQPQAESDAKAEEEVKTQSEVDAKEQADAKAEADAKIQAEADAKAQVEAEEEEQAQEENSSIDGYEFLQLVNNFRQENNLNEVTWSSGLDYAASVRAQEASVLWSHTRPDGSDWYTISELQNGENLAYGYSTIQATFDGWLSSDGHRANILNENFRIMSVKGYNDNGTIYWAQEFGY